MRSANSWLFAGTVGLVAAALLAGTYAYPGSGSTTSSTTTTDSALLGVVTGYVTVGPSRPVCLPGQSCNVNVSGYSIVFTPRCGAPGTGCPASTTPLSPSGHYSILLPAGNYSVTGLSPSCQWVGCSVAFPMEVEVQGGMQILVNFNIDTGIR